MTAPTDISTRRPAPVPDWVTALVADAPPIRQSAIPQLRRAFVTTSDPAPASPQRAAA